ncbi:MAG: CoA pyrophosphatase [Dehalococcoidia bacterium]|nr:CoA pyrophosphatase [Dehalococcoidia bacterium]
MYDNEVMLDALKKALAERKKLTIKDTKLKASAVLLPIFQKEGKCHIVFTKRTDHLSHHKGQISFPGGGRHNEDQCLMQTALRESYEEIGLREEDVEIIGELDDTATITSLFCITPFVGVIPYPYEFKKDAYEVEEIFDVSLEMLLKAEKQEEMVEYGGMQIKALSYKVGERIIWGATAGILTDFLGILRNVIGARCNR